jgi:hypothetical protein
MGKFFKMFELLEGSRKFLIMLIILTCSVIFRIYSLINGAEFVDLMKGCVIAFFASNIGEHVVNTIKDRLKELTKKGKK